MLTFANKTDYFSVNGMYTKLANMHHNWYPTHYNKYYGIYKQPFLYATEIKQGSNIYIIAREDGKNVGFCDLDISGKKAWVAGIFVNPKYRGKGIATEMLEKAKTIAKEKGFNELNLCVCNKNPSAEQLYKRLGFKTQQVYEFASSMVTKL